VLCCAQIKPTDTAKVTRRQQGRKPKAHWTEAEANNRKKYMFLANKNEKNF